VLCGIPGARFGRFIGILNRVRFGRFFLGRVLGIVLGACLGAILLALSHASSAALVGIAWGPGIGAAVGPLPILLFVKMLDALAPRRYTDGEMRGLGLGVLDGVVLVLLFFVVLSLLPRSAS
jgi:hypothetical protein